MPSDSIQQIRDKLDIVEVVSSYIKLEKTGINHRAPCPFHSEKKPSFFVSPARQMFKCFGCGAAGSIFDFIMKIEGVEFGDALRILAKRAGVELTSFRPELKTKRQRLYEICELSCSFFEKQLKASAAGKRQKDYFLKRGLTEESIAKWRLGYAPDNWRSLSDFLVSRGYKREEVVEAGLAVKSEKGGLPYDRFRGRIIFPVFDLHSQVVGFGGRITEQAEDTEVAKYLNTPNTLLYDKSRVLYGLNFGKVEIRKKDSCILTEGYMDVILCQQAGYLNTVASSGTSLTFQQLKVLKRYTSNLLFSFDMDFAGNIATKRGIDLAQAQDFQIKVIAMPKDKDPADIILENPKQWQDLAEEAKEIINFCFDCALSKFDKEQPQGKKQIAQEVLPYVKRIPNKIIQSHWAQKLARALKVSEEAIVEELKKIVHKNPLTEQKVSMSTSVSTLAPGLAQKPKQRIDLLEEQILGLVLFQPQHFTLLNKQDLDCFSADFSAILTACWKVKPSKKEDIAPVLAKLRKKQEIREILDNSYFLGEASPQQDITEVSQEIHFCLSQIKQLQTKNKLKSISFEIQTAEQQGDTKKVKSLMEQFNNLATYEKAQTKSKI